MATCDHLDYDDYFEKCYDCGMTGEQIHDNECPAFVEVTEDGLCANCGTEL